MAKALGKMGGSADRREALRQSVSSVGSAISRGLEDIAAEETGDYLLIPLDEIKPDPANPRWGGHPGPTWESIQDPEKATDQELKAQIEHIHELAKSMAPPVGLRTPIEVWRNGGWYQITAGECRYWASRLNAQMHVQVIVKPDPPARPRLVQYIENYLRSSPGLKQQIFNLEQIVLEAERVGEPIGNATQLIDRIGLPRATGFRFWPVVTGPQDVRAAIEEGKITTLLDAYGIAQEPDGAKRARMIADPQQRVAAIEARRVPKREPPASTRGRKREYVSFGKTRSTEVAKHVIQTLDPQGDHAKVDWADFKAVSQAWTALMARLERQFKPVK